MNPESEVIYSMERWFARLDHFHKAGADEQTILDYGLVVLHQCAAAKDWLKNAEDLKGQRDPNRPAKALEMAPISPDEIEALFEREELRVCVSIVNAAKHGALRDKKLIDRAIYTDTPYPTQERPFIRPLFVSPALKKIFEVLGLCAACIGLIKGFLVHHGWSMRMNVVVKDLDPNTFIPIANHMGTPWSLGTPGKSGS